MTSLAGTGDDKGLRAGASYAGPQVFSSAIGFFAGWAQVTSSTVLMVYGKLPAAVATLKLPAPGLADSQGAAQGGGERASGP